MMRDARFAIVLVAASAIAGPVSADDASPSGAAMSRGWEFGEQGGEELFVHVCAGCHQPDAKGAAGAATYPPLGQMMSDEQVADVVNYVRTHFGNSYAGAVSAAQVSAARRRTAPAP